MATPHIFSQKPSVPQSSLFLQSSPALSFFPAFLAPRTSDATCFLSLFITCRYADLSTLVVSLFPSFYCPVTRLHAVRLQFHRQNSVKTQTLSIAANSLASANDERIEHDCLSPALLLDSTPAILPIPYYRYCSSIINTPL